MPDLELVDMADSWSMDIQREITPPPVPALENERELISRGMKGNGSGRKGNGRGRKGNGHGKKGNGRRRKGNGRGRKGSGGITKKKPSLVRRFKETFQQSMFHDVGGPPVHFSEADLFMPTFFNLGFFMGLLPRMRIPPRMTIISMDIDFYKPTLPINMDLPIGELFNTIEGYSAIGAKNAKDSVLSFERKVYKEHVARLLDAVQSPDAVQFLNCERKSPCQAPHFDASKCGNLVLEAAKSELETYSTPTDDVEEAFSFLPQHRRLRLPEEFSDVGFNVKVASILPLVKQYFRDDHDLDVSLPPSFSAEEDDKGDVVLSIFSIPNSASPSTIVDSLVEAARSWKSQAGFTIHQVVAADMMLVQDLSAHVQPDQDVTIDQDLPHSIPEPGAVGTPEIKQHVKHPVVAEISSSTDCLEEKGDKPDSESEVMDIHTDEEDLTSQSGPSVESHSEIATADSHGPRPELSRKRSAASAFDEDSLFAKIRPFVNRQIEEALLPLMSALRSREEDEHKHRQKMLTLEQEKLALMRQKLECTRRSNAVPASIAK